MTTHLTVTGAEKDSWLALQEIIQILPSGWCVTGGSLVRLHLMSRAKRTTVQRATEDIDIILNVKARRSNIKDFENALQGCGFEPDGVNASGANHRWTRTTDHAKIDVLAPSGITETVNGWSFGRLGKLVPTRGAHFSIEEIEEIEVAIDGISLTVPAPSIIGALYGKCSALLHVGDSNKQRHLYDIASIVSVLTPEERELLSRPASKEARGVRLKGNPLSGRQKHRLIKGLLAAEQSPAVPHQLKQKLKDLVELIELESPGSYR